MPNLPAAEVVISLRDASTSVGRITLYVAESTLITAARAAIQALLGPLSNLTGCAVIGYSVSYSTHLSDGRGDGPQLKAYRGVFVWSTAQADEYAVTYLPGIKAALVDPDTNEIDQTDAEITALLNAIIAGPWVNPFGYAITGVESALLQVDP